MPFSPRRERELARLRRIRAAIQAEGKPAMEQALLQIDATFGEAAAVSSFKIKIERLLRLGPYHPAAQARFAARAALLSGRGLDAAVAMVERWWRDERKAFQIASALGCGTRLSLDVLRELRLILRLMRFKRMDARYCMAIDALCGEPPALAAE